VILNGERIEKAEINHGDTLVIGGANTVSATTFTRLQFSVITVSSDTFLACR